MCIKIIKADWRENWLVAYFVVILNLILLSFMSINCHKYALFGNQQM